MYFQESKLNDKGGRRIAKGLELSFKRLVEKTKKENGRLIFSKDGKIFYVQASDLK